MASYNEKTRREQRQEARLEKFEIKLAAMTDNFQTGLDGITESGEKVTVDDVIRLYVGIATATIPPKQP